MLQQATKLLADADAGAKRQLKAAKAVKSSTRYAPGTEWELLHSDAVILHALTLALRCVHRSNILLMIVLIVFTLASLTWDTFSAFTS